MDGHSERVVVGFDGSDAAGIAVDWAAVEASRRRVPLTVLYAADVLDVVPGPLPRERNPFEAAAFQLTADGVERARKTAHGIEVSGETHVAHPAGTLVEASSGAALLVVGTRGHGEVTGALLGSVAFAVTAHASCPVVVVRGDATPAGPDRPVVAAVDAWPAAAPVVDFAAATAAATGATLVIVSAYRTRLVELDVPDSVWSHEYDSRPMYEEVGQQAALSTVNAAVGHVRDRYPNVDVQTQVDSGSPAHVLTVAAKGSALLVVGNRGKRGFPGLLLGSVSHGLVHTAPCPLAVVHVDTHER